MWKALIKLIEKWGHRCEHDYELIIDRHDGWYQISVYRCAKCGKSEKIKI